VQVIVATHHPLLMQAVNLIDFSPATWKPCGQAFAAIFAVNAAKELFNNNFYRAIPWDGWD